LGVLVSLKNEYRLREQLRILGKKLTYADKHDAACCGTTIGQCRALQEMGKNDGINVNKLAENLNVDKSTISRSIDNLVKQNWAYRAADPYDRRYISLNLTAQGQEILENIEMRINKYHEQIFSTIPEEKREQVVESLDLLLKALDEAERCFC